MAQLVAELRDANRIMTSAAATDEGIDLVFADGRRGLIPFSEIPEIGALANLEHIELPNPYELILTDHDGNTAELPWDFARHFCDPHYRPRVEATAKAGRQSLGARLRTLREAGGLTQQTLATAAGIGRVTLSRIERGDQSPRHETLIALAAALGREPSDLLTIT